MKKKKKNNVIIYYYIQIYLLHAQIGLDSGAEWILCRSSTLPGAPLSFDTF